MDVAQRTIKTVGKIKRLICKVFYCKNLISSVRHSDFLHTILSTTPVYDWMILTTLVDTFSVS